MTGPEHYAEATALLIAADDGAADWESIVARAQVHATLALAAATAFSPHTLKSYMAEHRAWLAAAFTPADDRQKEGDI